MSPSKPLPNESPAARLHALLDAPLPESAGIGPARRARLAALLGDDARRRDALLALPSRLETTTPRPGDALTPGPAAFCFVATAPPRAWGRSGRALAGRVDEVAVELRWYRPPARPWLDRLATGEPHHLVGELVAAGDGGFACVHPRAVGPEAPARRPVHAGLDHRTTRHLAAVVADTLQAWPADLDSLDPATRAGLGVPSLRDALAVLHGRADGCPTAARRRLAVEEWLAFRSELAAARAALHRPARPLAPAGRLEAALRRRLPFRPTPSQDAVHATIRAELAGGRRMTRLVNGDVGSGKTLVAARAICDAVEAGRQAAVVAPSAALAAQHAHTLDGWLRPLGVETALVTGALAPGRRRPLERALTTGAVQVAVGTHALLEPRLGFHDLGLVVVDEQHRFGVQQRLTLTAKSRDAHLLVLTATPIPRSLARALDGTLAVSRLANRPGLGANVATRAVSRDRLDEVVARLLDAVAGGARAFWVCASIEGTDREPGAQARHDALATRCPGKVGLVTGRLPAEARATAIDAFRTGERPVLVATTVVEVGIDVPDATIMVVEGAERMGLAQLHQLRGRVGRGGQPASCLLLHEGPLSPAQHRRLDHLRRCHDGLALAEADLAARGAGETLGARQSGVDGFRFLDLARDAPAWATLTADGALDPRALMRLQPTVTGGLAAG
ncbi:MAG: DEAD/DEAH box helicase [Alphaproteobacteria bacterium]|nr:DEAD/DEAH box helicase [Alphaproteobacteria bacterium]